MREFADRKAGIVVHPVDLFDGETLHHAIFDHLAAAAAALLGRLEDHHGGAVEVSGFGEVLGGPEQHRGVAVVAAGVHLAWILRLVGQARRLLDRQRIHVRAQPDGAGGTLPLPAADDTDHAGAADAGHHLVAAEALELVGHHARSTMDVEHQFGMGVNILPPRLNLVVEVGDAVDDRHGALLERETAPAQVFPARKRLSKATPRGQVNIGTEPAAPARDLHRWPAALTPGDFGLEYISPWPRCAPGSA